MDDIEPKPPDDTQKTKRQRKDRSDKLKARKTLGETVVKMSLPGTIRGVPLKNELRAALEARVEFCSKRTHLASVAINLWAKELFHSFECVTQVPLDSIPEFWEPTFFRQLMLGTEGASQPYSCIQELHQAHPDLLVPTTADSRHTGDRNIYSAAAIKYSTNLRNHLSIGLPRMIKAYVYNLKGFDLDQHISMLYDIHGWSKSKTKPFAPVTPEMKEHIDEVRFILGLLKGDKIDKPWLKKKTNLPYMLRFSIHVSRVIEKIIQTNPEEKKIPKLWNILPICKIKRHFITVDSSALYGIMKDLKLIECNMDTFNALRMEHWCSVFKLPTWKKKTFTGTVDTDGVVLNVHYTHQKPKTNTGDEEQSPAQKTIPKGARVIGVDPGRTNILYCVEITKDGKERVYKLTRNQYYLESGIVDAREQTLKWSKPIQKKLEALSKSSPKGSSLESFHEYLSVRSEVQSALWSNYFHRRWAQQRFRLYGGKKRVISNFLNRIERDGEKGVETILAYGSAKFAPGGKGEVSVPTSRIYKECSYRFPIVLTSEFRSTRVHHETNRLLEAVGVKTIEGGKASVHSVRGLLWLPSTKSGEVSKFVNRDFNAALNILRCAMLPKRPDIMNPQKVKGRLPQMNIGKLIPR